jgi:hypothetical protein
MSFQLGLIKVLKFLIFTFDFWFGTHQNFQKCLLEQTHQNKWLQVSLHFVYLKFTTYIHCICYMYTLYLLHIYIVSATYIHCICYIYTLYLLHIYIVSATYIHCICYIYTCFFNIWLIISIQFIIFLLNNKRKLNNI